MTDRIGIPLIAFLLGVLLVGKLLTDELNTATDTIVALNTQLEEALVTCPENSVCYEPYGAAPAAEYVMSGSIVMVQFLDESQMPPDVEAWAEFTPDFDTDISICLIAVQFPTHILGDPIMDSIGHEFLHCIIGNFHP